MRKTEERLKRAQRELSRKEKGSRNREKTRRKLAKLHTKIRNKQSRKLVNTYSMIAVEELNIKGMVKNHQLAKSICDAGWGEFVAMLEYKAEEAGTKLVKVNPSNTSQECSRCGAIVPKGLSKRTHHCLFCGLILDRDINAARNILKKALAVGAA